MGKELEESVQRKSKIIASQTYCSFNTQDAMNYHYSFFTDEELEHREVSILPRLHC